MEREGLAVVEYRLGPAGGWHDLYRRVSQSDPNECRESIYEHVCRHRQLPVFSLAEQPTLEFCGRLCISKQLISATKTSQTGLTLTLYDAVKSNADEA